MKILDAIEYLTRIAEQCGNLPLCIRGYCDASLELFRDCTVNVIPDPCHEMELDAMYSQNPNQPGFENYEPQYQVT